MLSDMTRRLRDSLASLTAALSTVATDANLGAVRGRFDTLGKAVTYHHDGGDDTGFRAYMRHFSLAANATYSVFKTNFYHPGGGAVIGWGARLRLTNNVNATETVTLRFRIDGGAWTTFTGSGTSMAAFATLRGSATVANVGALTEGFHTFELGVMVSATTGSTEWVGIGDMEGSFFESPDNNSTALQCRWGQ